MHQDGFSQTQRGAGWSSPVSGVDGGTKRRVNGCPDRGVHDPGPRSSAFCLPASLLQEPVKGSCSVTRLARRATVFCTVAPATSSLTGNATDKGRRQLRDSLISGWTLQAATPDLTRGILGLRLPLCFGARVDGESDGARSRFVPVSLLLMGEIGAAGKTVLDLLTYKRGARAKGRNSCAMSAVAKAASWHKCRDCEETLLHRTGTGRVMVASAGRVHGQFQVGSGR